MTKLKIDLVNNINHCKEYSPLGHKVRIFAVMDDVPVPHSGSLRLGSSLASWIYNNRTLRRKKSLYNTVKKF